MKLLRAVRQAIEPNIQSTLAHALFFSGFASGVYGFWLIYHPVGFIVGGGLLVWFSLLIDKNESR